MDERLLKPTETQSLTWEVMVKEEWSMGICIQEGGK